jgi:hypothetical protein
MEQQAEFSAETYRELIPTLLSNILKIDYNNLDNLSVYASLSSLPRLPESEVLYLLYNNSTCRYVKHHIRENASTINGLSNSKFGIYDWTLDSAVGGAFSFYVLEEQKKDSSFLESYFEKSNNYFLLNYLVRNSIYNSLKCLESLADKSFYDLQKVAVATCSLETVRKLTKSNHEKVRLEAYRRLGPMECLDEMLVDKSRHVRSLAAEWMPMGYTVPQKALSDRSYWSFSKILEKASLDQIPMLLGNKKLAQNKHLMGRLQARLDSKF